MQFNTSITIKRRSASPAGYGGQPTGAFSTVATVWGRIVSSRAAGKSTGERQVETMTISAWLPPGTDVQTGDRLVAGSFTYRAVSGPAQVQGGAGCVYETVTLEAN